MTPLRVKSASVRPASTAERAVGRDRNRSMTPLMRVVVQPVRGGGGAEDGELGQDAGDEPVDVGAAGRGRQRGFDRAAEHVQEHDHENDRLDGR
jgi:hypothetical protein